MTTKVQKCGNSLAVRIPKNIAESISIKEGASLEFKKIGNKIVISPIKKKIYTLAELLKKFDKKKQPNLIFPNDKPRGQEVW